MKLQLFEKKLMKKVTDKYLSNDGYAPVIRTYQQFEQRWNTEKNELFSDLLDDIMLEYLSSIQIQIITEMYLHKKSADELAASAALTAEEIRVTEDAAISRLANPNVFRILYLGTEGYREFIAAKGRKIEDELKQSVREEYLTDYVLPNRALNCFSRVLGISIERLTVSEILDNIKSLSALQGCGFETMNAIIEEFKNKGYGESETVKGWEKEYAKRKVYLERKADKELRESRLSA